MTKEKEVTQSRMKIIEELSRPLIKYLNENHTPHHHIVITNTSAELHEGVMAFRTNDYIKD